MTGYVELGEVAIQLAAELADESTASDRAHTAPDQVLESGQSERVGQQGARAARPTG